MKRVTGVESVLIYKTCDEIRRRNDSVHKERGRAPHTWGKAGIHPARDPSLRLEPRGGAGEGQDTLPRRAKTSVVVRRLAAEGSKKKRKKKATNGNNKTLRASRLSFKSVRLVRVVKAEKVVVV